MNIKAILNGLGWTWTPFPAVRGERRMSHPRFVSEHPEGRYIIREAGHVSAVVDGVVMDTSRPYEGRCIYGAWRAPDG